jgi:hypothetical protein
MLQHHAWSSTSVSDISKVNKEHMQSELSGRHFDCSLNDFFDAFQHGSLPGNDERRRILLNKQRLLVAPREVLTDVQRIRGQCIYGYVGTKPEVFVLRRTG